MLALPPFQFAHETDNLTGTPPAALIGTNFTAGANSADGTAVGVIGALAHDVHFLVVGLGGISLATANGQCLVDVLIDPAGGTSWSELIDSLINGFTPVPTAAGISLGNWYYFPLFIKAGSSLGVRARTLHTVDITTGRAVMYALGNPSRPDMWWCGQKVESLGINAATSTGTNVTPGNSGAFGSWTSIGNPTAKRYGHIQMGVNGSDSTATAIGYYWQLGYGSNKLPGSGTFFTSNTTSEVGQRLFTLPMWCDIPAGTQMQVRGTASGTAEPHNVGLYGVY